MKTKLAALAVIASLALAGCSAGNQSAEATPSATATPSASPTAAPAISPASPSATESKAVDADQAWADRMINLFLNGNSKSSFEDFNKDLPHHYIESWKSSNEGTLNLTVAGGPWTSKQLDTLGNTIMFTAGNETEKLIEVHVSASDKSATGYADRDNLQDF